VPFVTGHRGSACACHAQIISHDRACRSARERHHSPSLVRKGLCTDAALWWRCALVPLHDHETLIVTHVPYVGSDGMLPGPRIATETPSVARTRPATTVSETLSRSADTNSCTMQATANTITAAREPATRCQERPDSIVIEPVAETGTWCSCVLDAFPRGFVTCTMRAPMHAYTSE